MASNGEQTATTDRFSKTLRSRTWGDHQKAESSGYMAALCSGQLSRAGYADMVAQHYYIYEVLEAAAESMRADQVGGPFVFPELTRLPSIEADLEYLLGRDWADQIAPNPATGRYCERMREVCFDWAGGFVAHHYTRYLGDLSGGQYIRDDIERVYALPDKAGIQFYQFPEITDLKTFKAEYRERLDGAGWDEAEQERVIDEVLFAYQINTEVLADLGRDMDRYLVG